MTRRLLRSALPCALAALLSGPASAAPPPEGTCPGMTGFLGALANEDAGLMRLREGLVLSYSDLLKLRDLIPREVWHHRDAFFYEGMRMEIGPCHRVYPQPSFLEKATAEFGGAARIDEDGNLEGYVAGVPFPQGQIDPKAPDAGARWAWNLELRYRGAGPWGKFRLVDMPSYLGSVETYRGDFFLIRTRHRADLEGHDYAVPERDETLFVSGGEFHEPFEARHLAWRQLRPSKANASYSKSDDTFVYVPTMRKMRRGATAWVDGMYTPAFRVGGDDGGGGTAGGGDTFGPTSSISPTAGKSIKSAEHVPRGFTDMALRPNAYVWRVVGEREVLAPLNGSRPGYPVDWNRNFGPKGLSVANDRWDVRWAVVIEGIPRKRGGGFHYITYYVDWQTLQPLYVIKRLRNRRLAEVGIPVHRFSGDHYGYPRWPTGEPAYVFDPVAASFYRTMDASGWRREAYDVRSVPPEASKLRRFLSTDVLMRGH